MRVGRRRFLRGAGVGAAALAAAGGLAGGLASVAAAAVPVPRANGTKPWRIGYAESMPFINYSATLEGIVRSLERQSWIKDTKGLPYEPGQAPTDKMWAWLASADLGPYVQFVPDAHHTHLDRTAPDAIVERLRGGDIDAMIVMGTIAGQKLATDAHSTPTLVFSTTNAVAAKIAQSETDSGRDHVWAHMDLRRFARQLRLFHDTFGFKRLGVAYEDSSSGRAIASIPDIEAAAEQFGFSIVRRHVAAPTGPADQERYYDDLARAWAGLAEEADAVYITYGRWQMDRFADLARVFVERRIPTFSQLGPEEVERGALMSVARVDFLGIGQFGAGTLAGVMNGTKPRALPQVYFDTPTIAWNLETARRIGHRVPFQGLLAADQIYTRIGG